MQPRLEYSVMLTCYISPCADVLETSLKSFQLLSVTQVKGFV